VNDETERRRAVMAICAEAGAAELQRAVSQCGAPAAEDIRAPETGLVMVRGRTGGDGAAFNIGEASVTRVAVTLGGQTGFAYQLGRNVAKARNAAVLDALWQSPAHRTAVEAAVHKIAERQAAERAERERQTAATRVNFFTMVRGED
jgi:alpha-D-ribose 1-methylphosphonate 5-triphosphate synthase subunit PhnG